MRYKFTRCELHHQQVDDHAQDGLIEEYALAFVKLVQRQAFFLVPMKIDAQVQVSMARRVGVVHFHARVVRVITWSRVYWCAGNAPAVRDGARADACRYCAIGSGSISSGAGDPLN